MKKVSKDTKKSSKQIEMRKTRSFSASFPRAIDFLRKIAYNKYIDKQSCVGNGRRVAAHRIAWT